MCAAFVGVLQSNVPVGVVGGILDEVMNKKRSHRENDSFWLSY